MILLAAACSGTHRDPPRRDAAVEVARRVFPTLVTPLPAPPRTSYRLPTVAELPRGPVPAPLASVPGVVTARIEPPPMPDPKMWNDRLGPVMVQLAALVAPDLDDAVLVAPGAPPITDDDPVSYYPDATVGAFREYVVFDAGDRELAKLVSFLDLFLEDLHRSRRLLLLSDGSVVGGPADVIEAAVADHRLHPQPP